jgi:hypothetical protein
MKETITILISAIAVVMSGIALFFSLRDRRPRLALRTRKGEWCVLLEAATVTKQSVGFRGVVEVYNVSSRANAVQGYEFWCKRSGGAKWELMESEMFSTTWDSKPEEVSNPTPVTIAPYSGTELHVAAFTAMPMPKGLDVRVLVEDLFGKRYQVEVKARSRC